MGYRRRRNLPGSRSPNWIRSTQRSSLPFASTDTPAAHAIDDQKRVNNVASMTSFLLARFPRSQDGAIGFTTFRSEWFNCNSNDVNFVIRAPKPHSPASE